MKNKQDFGPIEEMDEEQYEEMQNSRGRHQMPQSYNQMNSNQYQEAINQNLN